MMRIMFLMRAVDLVGIQFDPAAGVSVLVLRERDDPNRLLPIVVAGADAASIAMAAQGVRPPRPMTHDLMASLIASLEGQLDGVEVTEVRDGAFVAELAVSGPTGHQRLDTRPSDAIALAIRLGAPLAVSEQVLDIAGAVPVPSLDPDPALDPSQIENEVDTFRQFLAEVDPADFDAPPTG
jgi:uncharacterized protein